MANGSDIDSWKTGAESDGSSRGNYANSQRKITLIDHYVRTAGTRENATLIQAKNSRSGSEIQYINPAIYTESVSEEEYNIVQKSESKEPENFNGQIIDTKCSDCNCSTINLPSAKDATNINHATEHSINTGQSTYRCYSSSLSDTTLSLEPSTARSAVSSGTIARTERRCKISSIVENIDQNEVLKQDNRQVVRISITSLSDSLGNGDQVSNGSDFDRKIAHSEWIRKKHEAARRKKKSEELATKKLQEEEEKIIREKEEKARLEKENFLKWMERKKQQKLDRKAMLENELELQERLKKIEEKTAVAKALCLRHWIHKKKEEQKARDRDQEMRQRKLNEERARRLEQSSQAYEKWREESKNRPKPATQGLLPHQKAKPAYVNPIPWQPIVEINSDEERKNAFDNNKGNIICTSRKMSNRKSIAVHQ